MTARGLIRLAMYLADVACERLLVGDPMNVRSASPRGSAGLPVRAPRPRPATAPAGATPRAGRGRPSP